MRIGDTVSCEVARSGQWGAYVITESGEQGFINFLEFSWNKNAKGPNYLPVGSKLQAIVIGLLDPLRNDAGASFLGSLRKLHPELNPWRDPTIYQVGREFEGTITSIWDWGLFVRLDTGANAAVIPLPIHEALDKLEGQRVRVQIIAVSPALEKIEVEIVSHSPSRHGN